MYLIDREAVTILLASLELDLEKPYQPDPANEGIRQKQMKLLGALKLSLASKDPEYETRLRIDEREEAYGNSAWRPLVSAMEDGGGVTVFDDTKEGMELAKNFMTSLEQNQTPAVGYRVARLHSVVVTVMTLAPYQRPKPPPTVPKSIAQWSIPKFLEMVQMAARATSREDPVVVTDVLGGGIRASVGVRAIQRTDGVVSWFTRDRSQHEPVDGVDYGFIASWYEPAEWATWLAGGAPPAYRDDDEETEETPSIIPEPVDLPCCGEFGTGSGEHRDDCPNRVKP